ncbi:MAG: fibronectin/fibrinogen-binding protein [Clostridiales bacterium]|uniref:Rqc2 family fibronectin-binding protein n=1 Tax=Clostridium sp. N3C TaxID=1776758 RepID=UPI000945A587|nr:NFACT RNA binding domain-containing protein [Clostridium sp. N3C]NLZ47346.1 fibronectin/fibrinogen-binding protein [Clostridiales bacterium]
MALDGIFLHALCLELKDNILNGKVDKVNQPEKDEIVITFRKENKNIKVLLSASSNYPRIHVTERSKANPIQPPMFCMLLRKYLIGAKLVNIKQINCDRILCLDFESRDEMGFDSIYTLIIEIMGRHSNITLIRKRDNIVMDSIKHITPNINSYRSIYPGINYKFPPESNKLNPLDFSAEANIDLDSSEYISDSNFLSKIFTGVSPLLSKEIITLFQANKDLNSPDGLKKLLIFSKNFFQNLTHNSFTYTLYCDSKGNYKDFYCFDLSTMKDYKATKYDNASKLLDVFYYTKDKQDRLNQKSSDLQKLVNNNIDRCKKKSTILKQSLQECSKKDKYKLYGELLTANIYSIKEGDKNIKVYNYYSENEEYVTIPLKENNTPSENIQSYFKKYNKLKKTEEAALEQLEKNEAELEYLQSVLTNIINCDSYDEIEDIRRELVETGYIKFKKSTSKAKGSQSKPLHFISSDGNDIYVGKNNIQNDYLTLKFADKKDIWLHTKNIPGSHVIIKNNNNISDKTLEEAAILAAYYSKAKDSTKVPVDYTEVKNVKKPSGAKPGMVIYTTNKTIYVDPYDIDLKKV